MSAIRQAYLPNDEALLSLPDAEFRDICIALNQLGDPCLPQTAAQWASAHGSWRQWNVHQLRLGLANHLIGETDEVVAARKQVSEHAVARLEAFCATDDSRDLFGVGELLHVLGLTGAGQEYPQYAAALARQAQAGVLTKPKDLSAAFEQELARPLGTEQVRQVVRSQLLNEDGSVRLVVAGILSCAYSQCGASAQWLAFLDEQAKGCEGDAKAMWLMARAHAATVTPGLESSLWAGQPWLREALASAVSEQTKVMVVRRLAEACVAEGQFDAARSLLSSIQGQFGEAYGPLWQADLAAIEAAQQKHHEDATLSAVRQQQARKAAWAEEMHRRLAEARARNDQEAIQRIESLLAD